MKNVKNAVLAVICLSMVMMFGSAVMASSDTYACSGVDIYLALRSAKAFDYNNEIGKIYPGETVEVQSYDSGTYWYVYCPKLNKYGYVNNNYLVYAGGSTPSPSGSYKVKVDSGYLALRNAKAFDYNNEIGELYSGDSLDVLDTSDSQYWYVYSPKLNKYGYVNKDYVYYSGGSKPSGTTYKVRVSDGYLALRTAKAFDYNNEIGKLYTDDKVEVLDTSDSQYWYVYSPKHDKYGYVNKDYLKATSGSKNYSTDRPRTVKVSSGYLALRTAMAYDYNNEIGELYTGDTVYVQDKTSDQYWYVYSPKHNKFGYVNKDYLVK